MISTHIVSDVEYIASKNAIMKEGKIVDDGNDAMELDKTDEEGKVWEGAVSVEDLTEYEKRLRVVSRRDEGHGLVFVRYLSEQPELPKSATVPPRLEDLYLWLFPQTVLEKEVN